LGGAAAAEGHDAINALDMDGSSCGFDRARSHPAMIIKGAKKAAYYPKMRHSPQSLARRLASPFFLPTTTSYHEVLTVAQQAEFNAAHTEAEASRPVDGLCHAAPRLSLLRLLPPPYPSITLFAGTSPKSVNGVAGGTRRQQHTRFGRDDIHKATALLEHRST
jgi:hypothetical protein